MTARLSSSEAWLQAKNSVMERPGMTFIHAWMSAAKTPSAIQIASTLRRKYWKIIWIGDLYRCIGVPWAT